MDKKFFAKVEDVSEKGAGIVRDESGRVFFCAGVWTGDEGIFAAVSQMKTYGFAKLVELQKPSPSRRHKVLCEYHGFDDKSCGGCPWFHVEYDAQIAMKNKLVKYRLEKTGLAKNCHVNSMIAAKKETGYRNRCQLKSDGMAVGFVSHEDNRLIPIERCAVLDSKTNLFLAKLNAKMPLKKPASFSATKWATIDVDEDFNPESILVNKRSPFRQANNDQNLRMKDWLGAKLKNLSKSTQVVELFCGSGNFTEVLVRNKFRKILAVECDKIAVTRLEKCILNNTEVICADLYSSKSWPKIFEKLDDPTILFLDPPREGFKELSKFLRHIPGIHSVIYVSCNLDALMRDCKPMLESGWCLNEVQPIDMVPQTPHIELIAVFQKGAQFIGY